MAQAGGCVVVENDLLMAIKFRQFQRNAHVRFSLDPTDRRLGGYAGECRRKWLQKLAF